MRLVLSEPARRNEGRRHDLINRDALQAEPGKPLGVGGATFGGIIGDEYAGLAMLLEQIQGLNCARKQAILSAPQHPVTIEKKGVMVVDKLPCLLYCLKHSEWWLRRCCEEFIDAVFGRLDGSLIGRCA